MKKKVTKQIKLGSWFGWRYVVDGQTVVKAHILPAYPVPS